MSFTWYLLLHGSSDALPLPPLELELLCVAMIRGQACSQHEYFTPHSCCAHAVYLVPLTLHGSSDALPLSPLELELLCVADAGCMYCCSGQILSMLSPPPKSMKGSTSQHAGRRYTYSFERTKRNSGLSARAHLVLRPESVHALLTSCDGLELLGF